jgi:hypothetical protein
MNKSMKDQLPSLKVQFKEHKYTHSGIQKTIPVPIFLEHSVFKTKLPKSKWIASDEEQFSCCVSSLKKDYLDNPEVIKSTLMKENKRMIDRDIQLFKANKKAIKEAEEKMLNATKNKNLEQQAKWLKELRRLTHNITFIQTPKGKPYKILSEDEILKKQIKDITNPPSNAKGRIFGYIWHHNEKKGVIELVAKDVHEANPHVGGNKIWGDGVR